MPEQLTFADLRAARRRLQDLCSLHGTSVNYFKRGNFYPTHPEDPDPADPPGPGKADHITSTATCLEGLLQFPDASAGGQYHPEELAPTAQNFSRVAVQDDDWKSEDEARIYCRCRALPFVIQNLVDYHPNVVKHLKKIFEQLRSGGRFAIGEDPGLEAAKLYPPNAFHTYWALRAIEAFSRRPDFAEHYETFKQSVDGGSSPLSLERVRAGMMLWAWKTLGYEIGLHTGISLARDTDQLAWALAIVTRFDPTVSSGSDLKHRDLIAQALDCLFGAQDPLGTWPHSTPLFHYAASGSAYCYTFENMAALLESALLAPPSLLRVMYSRYHSNLLQLVDYAESTAARLPGGGLAWSSGHRGPAAMGSESWATSSVFSFLQLVRCLFGLCARGEAMRTLTAERPRILVPHPLDEIRARGQTWESDGSPTPAEYLLTRFVFPTLRSNARGRNLDPDIAAVEPNRMRSAILYGPPGTSKSHLVRATAAAIGWEYVEILASHFVADGLPNVHRQANILFTHLMEIDHVIVFFDEFDELVRHRDGDGDTFGRFLTTAMLPKLAELWKSRRVLFFVATNHIELFDDAVKRNERFDALFFIPPPAYGAKVTELTRILKEDEHFQEVRWTVRPGACESALEDAIRDAEQTSGGSSAGHRSGRDGRRALAKFALLRWDELGILARCLAKDVPGQSLEVNSERLAAGLAELGISRLDDSAAFTAFAHGRRSKRINPQKAEVWAKRPTPGNEIELIEWVRDSRARDTAWRPSDVAGELVPTT